MPRTAGFENVEAIARTLPGVEVTTAWGQPDINEGGNDAKFHRREQSRAIQRRLKYNPET